MRRRLTPGLNACFGWRLGRSHAETAGCRYPQQSRQAEYRPAALPRWSRRGEMSGASVYRIPSAQEVNQFTFEDRELI
jgi:hypothetical protein